jgi:ABC-type branched-subunit amino acid transport system ATPase component
MSTGLTATGIEVTFGGVHALRGVDVAVDPGQVAGLIGRNGSGKTTLFNCITGFVRPTAGRTTVDGVDVTGLPPDRVVKHGIARTFQTPRVDPRATVQSAVLCGFYSRVGASFVGSLLGTPRAWREEQRLHQRAEPILERLGLAELRDREVGKLSMGLIRLVEVARCLASGARFVLLDEPAAGLTPAEQERLAEQVRAVAASGVGVLIVEHNIGLVRALCDTATALETGRVLCAGAPEAVVRDERVMRSYLGAIGDLAATEVAA